MLKVKVFTIFPDAFPSVLGLSIPKRAMDEGFWSLKVIDIKNFATDKHKTVDETPFGGGAGMLMKVDVLSNAIESELNGEEEKPLIILTSARGLTFNQKIASQFALETRTIYFICGRFEGVDERFIEHYNAIEMNLGKFVLFGGEVAVLTMLEAVIRLLPDVLGNEETKLEESYAQGTEFEDLMEYPQYTKPREWNGLEVPAVLLSGNHKKIKEWRLEEAKKITLKYQSSKSFLEIS
jgi:tRNA (guanine37-N1)-methyltransferase